MDEKTERVVKLFQEHSSPKYSSSKPSLPPQTAGNVIQISERAVVSGQIIGGDVYNNYITAKPPVQRIVIQPGDDVISEAQKVTIAVAREEWLQLHEEIKGKPLDPRTAWVRINRAGGATSYHLIPAARFEQAMAFIRKEMAILRSAKKAPAKDVQWRSKRIGAIKARCTNQLGDPEAYKQYIKRRFNAESLGELATDDLQATYAYIMHKKSS